MKVENTVKTNFEQYAYGKLKSLIKRVIEIKNHEYNFIDNKNINAQQLVQSPVHSSKYPNTIGETKPPSPPNTPTIPPTTPTSSGK